MRQVAEQENAGQWIVLFLFASPLAAVAQVIELLWWAWLWVREQWTSRRSLRVLAAAAAVVALPILPVAHHLYLDRSDLPELAPFLRFEPPMIGHMFDARGAVLMQVAREYREVVTYDEIPPVLRQALLSAEDKNFFAHSGVDYSVLPRVAVKVFKASAAAGRIRLPQGGSTLTQQLVRNYFLPELTSNENGGKLLSTSLCARGASAVLGVSTTNKLLRKLEEARLALWLEREMERHYGSKREAKEQILARYASFIYLGNGRYGFATAADYYFGRPLSTFAFRDADKAAVLAGLLKCPGLYAPTPANEKRSRRRRDEVLQLMEVRGHLTPDLATRLRSQPLATAAVREPRAGVPAALEHVVRELKRDGRFGIEALLAGSINVHVTVDGEIQTIVDEALEEGLAAYERRHRDGAGLVQGAAVVLRNRDAAILALKGGRERYRGQHNTWSDYNRVVEARRQPGSAMKPILYLAAFRGGSALDEPVPDEPIAAGLESNGSAKWIANYDGLYRGTIPIREALAESRNAAAMWVAKQVGMGSVLNTAEDLGLRSSLRPMYSTALGASELSLLELANLYRAIASGLRAEPFLLRRVTDSTGAVRFTRASRSEPLNVEPLALLQVQEGLRGTIRLPRGTAHSLDGPGFPVPVMGKTGTTNDFRDALFVGSTYGAEGVTVAVWIGFDDNRSLGRKESGARNALPVFARIMRGLYSKDRLGAPPVFPDSIETGITAYLSRHAVADPTLGALEPTPGVVLLELQ